MNLVKDRPKKDLTVFEENAKLRGALIEMLTAHGKASHYEAFLYRKLECGCHACTNARKLLAGES